jgi:hypothetical protein
MFKCLKYQSDTYHDTWTHYLMEKDPLPCGNQVGVVDVDAGDVYDASMKRRAPLGICYVHLWLSTLHVYNLWALRHDLLSYP